MSQAEALIECLPAHVVMADNAHDGADRLREVSSGKDQGANNPFRARKHPLDKHLYA